MFGRLERVDAEKMNREGRAGDWVKRYWVSCPPGGGTPRRVAHLTSIVSASASAARRPGSSSPRRLSARAGHVRSLASDLADFRVGLAEGGELAVIRDVVALPNGTPGRIDRAFQCDDSPNRVAASTSREQPVPKGDGHAIVDASWRP